MLKYGLKYIVVKYGYGREDYFNVWNMMYSKAAVLNLWSVAHWWTADLCLVGRDQGWELRNFFVSHVSQSMKWWSANRDKICEVVR